MSYTVKQLSDYFQVSNTTIRSVWTDEFAEYLSEGAKPPKGQARIYSEKDVAVFQTVAIMRSQGKEYSEIHELLAKGERLESEDFSEPPNQAGETSIEDSALVAYTATLELYETRLEKTAVELREERKARLEAEIRAAKAETELELLKDLASKKKMSFAEWIRSRRD